MSFMSYQVKKCQGIFIYLHRSSFALLVRWVHGLVREILLFFEPFNFLLYFCNYFFVSDFFSFPDLRENLAAILLCKLFMSFEL